jgi:RNA polymerase sigma-70 factor (ECF subfamily)
MSYLRRNLTRSSPAPTPIRPEMARSVDRIVREYEAYLRRVLIGRGVRLLDTDDELQQVWETLVRKAACLSGDPRTWLLAVAINRSGNYHQERHLQERRLAAGLEGDARDAAPNAEETLIGAEVMRLVDRLDPELRAVVVGCMAGETIEELSASLRIPQGSVASRLRRARARLKTELSRGRMVPIKGRLSR